MGYSLTAAGSTKISGCGIAHCILSDDYGQKYDLKIPANYSEDCPCRLVSPQWTKKCKKANGMPKELQSHLDLEDDYYIFHFDRRSKSKKMCYHPTQMVPVMKVNEELKSYESFKSAFCSIIQEQPDRESKIVQDNIVPNDKVAFRSIEDTSDRSNLIKAATKIAKNKDIHVSIEDVQSKDSHKPHSLSKNQRELLSIHNRLNHEVSIKDTQLLAAAGYFPKRLATCSRPQCCECHFGKAHRKA